MFELDVSVDSYYVVYPGGLPYVIAYDGAQYSFID